MFQWCSIEAVFADKKLFKNDDPMCIRGNIEPRGSQPVRQQETKVFHLLIVLRNPAAVLVMD